LAGKTRRPRSLVLPARARPVLLRPENAFAEQPARFRFAGFIVDRPGVLNLSAAPGADLLGRGQADADRGDIGRVEHNGFLCLCHRVLLQWISVGPLPNLSSEPAPRPPAVWRSQRSRSSSSGQAPVGSASLLDGSGPFSVSFPVRRLLRVR